MVITTRVLCCEAAAPIVMPLAARLLAGRTSGNMRANTAPIASRIAKPVDTKAHPSRPLRTTTQAAATATLARTPSTSGNVPLIPPGVAGRPARATQATVVPTSTVAAIPHANAARRAPRLRSPEVFSDRKTEPWNANSARLASPPASATGCSRPMSPP